MHKTEDNAYPPPPTTSRDPISIHCRVGPWISMMGQTLKDCLTSLTDWMVGAMYLMYFERAHGVNRT